MPDWCVNTRCIDCDSHAILKGKVDCNYMNRLGLSQPTVKTFLDTKDRTPEQAAKELEELDRQTKELEERRKLLASITSKGENDEQTT